MSDKLKLVLGFGDDSRLPAIPPQLASSDPPMEVLAAGANPDATLGSESPNFITALAQKLYAPAGQVLQGLIPGADEAESGIRALLTDETYDGALSRIRGENEAYQAENPWTSVGLQAAGALPTIPLLLSGAGIAAKGGLAGYRAAQAAKIAETASTAKNLSTIQSIGNAALKGIGAGGAQGAAYGFGQGEGFLDRVSEGTMGAAIGAGLGGVTGAGAAAVGAGLQSEGVQRIAERLKQTFATPAQPQRGAIGGMSLPPSEIPSLTSEEAFLANWTRDIPADHLDAGAVRMNSAIAEGAPLLPAEAVNRPSLYHLARDVRNSNEGIDTAEGFLKPRQAGTQERYYGAFDDAIPGEVTSEEGLLGLKQAMQSRVDQLDRARAAETKPLYNAAIGSNPVIESPRVAALLEDEPEIMRAIKDARSRFGETLDGEKIKDLPDNSLALLRHAKGVIDDKVATAKKLGDKTEFAQYSRIQSKIKSALEPYTGEADRAFEAASKPLNRLAGSEEERGIFEGFLRIQDENASSIGNKLFSLQPARIRAVKEALGEEGAEKFTLGVKAHLQDLVEKRKDGFEQLVTLTKTDRGRKQLDEAIGGQSLDKLTRFFEREGLMKEGDRRYFLGSPTQSAQEVAAKRKGMLSRLIKTIRSFTPGGALEQVADAVMTEAPSKNAQLMKQLAKALFDPTQGSESLNKIAKYRKMRDPWIQSISTATNALRKGGVRGESSTDIDPLAKK